MRSIALAALTRGDFDVASSVGRQLLATAERGADDVLLVEAQYVLGVAAFWQGGFDAARGHLEAAVRGYRPEHRAAHLARYGQDPKVVCQARLGNALWMLGLPAEARQASDDAVSLAAQIGHPYSHAVALVFGALLAVDWGEIALLRRRFAELNARRHDGHGPQVELAIDAFEGYLEVLDGQVEAGLARIAIARDRARKSAYAPGFEAAIVRVLLAAVELAGDPAAGLAAAEQAIGAGRGSVVWEAEARRLRAEFLAQLDAPDNEIEQELRRALELARRQGAVPFEQRVLAALDRRPSRRRNASGTHARP